MGISHLQFPGFTSKATITRFMMRTSRWHVGHDTCMVIKDVRSDVKSVFPYKRCWKEFPRFKSFNDWGFSGQQLCLS